MNIFNNTLKVFYSAAIFSFCLSAYATGGHAVKLDCETKNDDCSYPAVGMLTFVSQDSDGEIYYNACSGSLLHKDATKFVILTAGHCVAAAEEYLPVLLSRTLLDVTISFDPVVINPDDAPKSLQGGTSIFNPHFYSYLAPSNLSKVFDMGLFVFPRDATNQHGETIDDLYPNLAPVKMLGNDTTETVESLLGKVHNKKAFIAQQVGYGLTWVSQDGGAPYFDYSTLGMRNVADMALANTASNTDNLIRYDSKPKKDGVAIGSGDSGSPQFYRIENDQGEMESVQISTLFGGETYSGSIHAIGFRADHPDGIALVNCVRNADADEYEDQLLQIQACVDDIR